MRHKCLNGGGGVPSSPSPHRAAAPDTFPGALMNFFFNHRRVSRRKYNVTCWPLPSRGSFRRCDSPRAYERARNESRAESPFGDAPDSEPR